MAEVRLKDVRVAFGEHEVLKGIDLTVQDGEFVVFVGPSGCGKSTLLRTLAGLQDVSSGEIRIDGRVVNNLSPKDRGIAMVFQSYALYPHRTVRGNMAFGLRLAKLPKQEIAERVTNAARMLGIEELLDRRPAQLSGGQRQRVAIGRAIVREPAAFLFDEPLSNLDAALRTQTRREIAALHRNLGATSIYVTHDQVEAMTLADRIVVLEGGRVRQIGTPRDLYETPVDRFVAQFVGSPRMNVLPAHVVARDGDGARIDGPGLGPLHLPAASPLLVPGRKISVGIRPEHLTFADRGITGRVSVVEYLGDEALVDVTLADGTTMLANTGTEAPPTVDQTVALRVDPVRLHVFDDQDRVIPMPIRPGPAGPGG